MSFINTPALLLKPAVIVIPPTLSFVSASRPVATSAPIAGVLAKDLVLVYTSTAGGLPEVPVPPAGWTVLDTYIQGTNWNVQIAKREAVTDGEFSSTGVWATAGRIAYGLYRPANGRINIRQVVRGALGAGSSLTLPALASPVDGSWRVMMHHTQNLVTSATGYPAGSVHRLGPLGSGRITLSDLGGPAAGPFPAATLAMSSAHSGAIAYSIELEPVAL
jgi:hypothetical protein